MDVRDMSLGLNVLNISLHYMIILKKKRKNCTQNAVLHCNIMLRVIGLKDIKILWSMEKRHVLKLKCLFFVGDRVSASGC